MDLSIIIVNYNTKKLTVDCLKALVKNTRGVNYEIIVVDNASSDGSADLLEKEFPDVRVIRNDENAGFAKASNKAIRAARGKNILLLNSDTVVSDNCLYEILKFSEARKDAGIIGCKVLNQDGTLQHSCFHMPNPLTEFVFFAKGIIKDFWDPVTWHKYMRYCRHKAVKKVGCVSGCFFWVKRPVFEQIGMLDENMFMYYEEIDFCRRVKAESPYSVYYYPFAWVTHLKDAGQSDYNDGIRHIYCYQSAKYYCGKYYGRKITRLFDFLCRVAWRTELRLFRLLSRNQKIRKKAALLEGLLDSGRRAHTEGPKSSGTT